MKGFVRAMGDMFKMPTTRWFYPALGITVFMSTSVLIWLPSLVQRLWNVGEDKSGLLVGGIGLAAIIGAPLGGFLADFWQKRTPRGRMYVPAVANLAGAVLVILFILLRLNPLGIALGVMYGIIISMSVPAFAAVSQDIVPAAHKGLSMGLAVFAQYVFGGAWGPWLIGWISDMLGGGADGLSLALIISTAGGLLGGIFFILAARTYPSDAEKVKQEVILAE